MTSPSHQPARTVRGQDAIRLVRPAASALISPSRTASPASPRTAGDCATPPPDGTAARSNPGSDPDTAGIANPATNPAVNSVASGVDPAGAAHLPARMVHLARVATLGTLAASIAHEIRQPLTAIRLEAGAIQRWVNRDAPVLEEVMESARRIHAQSERAEQLIRGLRALMCREPAARAAFLLDQALLEVVPLAQCAVHAAEIHLEIDLDTTLPPLFGDRVQVQQVALNLLVNAVEARRDASAGQAVVRLRTRREGADSVRIEVADNGIGIAPDALSRMFEPFFTTKGDGMGIGLAICRSIVERHGGTIHAACREGWTTLVARLPIRAA